MRQGRAAGLAALAAVLLVAAGRAQVQQEPWAQTREGSGIDIACSHPNIQSNAYIHWYRQFPGQGPAFLVRAYSGSEDVTDPAGRLSVAGDRRSSTLRLARPRLRDAAVYYCALRATGRGAGAAAVQEPWRAGPGVCGGGEAGAQPPGGAAAPPARTTSSRSRGGSPASPDPSPLRPFGSSGSEDGGQVWADPSGCEGSGRHTQRCQESGGAHLTA
nr:immunoglobulin gamma-1 heavy chain-like [Anas platyrhynchos]